jgi:arsenite methyltransferase
MDMTSGQIEQQAPVEIRERVRDKYGSLAKRAAGGGGGCCAPVATDPITSNLYGQDEATEVPEAALAASLGCGNPTALAELRAGETVLDLGSGGGIDVILSAKRVGPTGFAYGLDMTDEMLELANRNKQEAGIENVEFLKGHIEDIPLPDDSVDVIISNCVINLSGDKPQVIREAFRVLKPGGRFAVSDVVSFGQLPDGLRKDMEAWVGCVAGALDADDYTSYLRNAGFDGIEIQVTREYDPRDLAESMSGGCCTGGAVSWNANEYEAYYASGGKLVSAFVRATKPGGSNDA